MINTPSEQITHMQAMAKANKTASEILCYLAIDCGIEEQVVLMQRFKEAFNCPLGSVTAIGAWWHDSSCELNNEAIDAYIMAVINDYREKTL